MRSQAQQDASTVSELKTYGHWHLLEANELELHWLKDGLVARPKDKTYNSQELSYVQSLLGAEYRKGKKFYEYTDPEDDSKAYQTPATRIPASLGLVWQQIDCGDEKTGVDGDIWYVWQWRLERAEKEDNGFKFYGPVECTEKDEEPECPPGGCIQ